ncbi:Down syndrome cell adhesion molecule-like protein Dscam2 [Araneus ventricosus]|uniref:Down syndrome cell adhesion molecule-like protein Dscam2 n=1 Tax=Araneus ventricosus TaxID=182803 RepID=A0A4Y2C657_ARAVE|nr:Down syndrome cell adhesion molecule-like protein Dscam2 [Araneus ventricosus]
MERRPDVAPVLKHTFEPAKVEPGSSLSLKCIASGNPLPQVTWTLDDLPIPDHMRFSVGDYVTSKAEVVSFVNISTLRVEDGGAHLGNLAGDLSASQRENFTEFHLTVEKGFKFLAGIN